jgi:hypothetical protein
LLEIPTVAGTGIDHFYRGKRILGGAIFQYKMGISGFDWGMLEEVYQISQIVKD